MRNLVPKSLFRWTALGALGLLGAILLLPNARLVPAQSPDTTTPIKYLVVIFQENVSFDHYFATYPNAANLSGEPAFFHSELDCTRRLRSTTC
jgi:phospholipase C